MHKKTRKAFTIIEVMVAVMIVCVVVMALLKMQGNTTHIFSKLHKSMKADQFITFFISDNKYGFDKGDVYLNEFLGEFNVDDELRRKLKDTKIELSYKRLNYFDSMSDKNDNSELKDVIEIGRTTLTIGGLSTSLIRLKIQ